MILSVAHAAIDEASSAHLLAEWSNLLVGDRPAGLIDCYLVKGEGIVQVVATWTDADDHNRALEDEQSHPAFAVFEAAGLDPTHTVFEVMGRLK